MKVFATLPPATRRNLFLMFLGGLCFWSSLTILLPTLPLYIESVGANQQQVGLVMGSFAIGLILSRGMMGQWADHRSRKLVVQIGTFVVGAAPFCYLWVESLGLLATFRALHGISIAGLTTGYSALVVDLSPVKKRGEIVGYMTLVAPIGMALGPMIGSYIVEIWGYTVLFAIAGSLGFLAFTFVSGVEEQSLPQKQTTPTQSSHFAAQILNFVKILGKSLAISRWGELLQSRRLSIPALTLLLVGLVFGTVTTFVPAYIRDSGVDMNAGLFYLAVAVASFSVRLFAGRASDRLGRGLFITLSLISYLLSMVLLARAQSRLEFIIAGLAEGAGAGTLLPMMTTLVADRTTQYERGQSFALCIGGFDVGLALGGPVAGTFAPWVGYSGIFALAAGIAAIAFCLFLTQSSKTLQHSLRFATGQEKDIYALD